MKKILQYSGIISIAFALVAFILMLATPAFQYVSGSTTTAFSGSLATFGGKVDGYQKAALEGLWGLTTDDKVSLAPVALIAFILGLLGFLVVTAGVVLPIAKVKGIDKYAGILNIAAVALFIASGILMFTVLPSFFSANDYGNVPNTFSIGAGWVIGGILYIVAGAFAILPTVFDFIGKTKRNSSN